MKNSVLVFLPILLLTVWSCHNEPQVSQIKWLESDSIALVNISYEYRTASESYPHPWNVQDRSTWEGNVELGPITDPRTGEPALAVSSLTLYIDEPSNPMGKSLLDLEYLRDFKYFACPGAVFNPHFIPIGCDSLTVDKIDPNEGGYIKVPGGKWYTWAEIFDYNWLFSKLIVHWVDTREITFLATDDAKVDLSYNQLDVALINYINEICGPNLSHNKFTADKDCWSLLMELGNRPDLPFPNLQYNEIEIPEDLLGTEFWINHHEYFIGNPGYIAPNKN